MLYQYWLVRYVPDSARPDTVSAGVVVGGEDPADCGAKFVPHAGSLPPIGTNREVFFRLLLQLSGEVSLFIQQEKLPLGGIRDLRIFMERQRRQNYGIIQFDPPGQVVAPTVEEAVHLLYERLVFRENLEVKQHRVSKLRSLARSEYESFSRLKEHTVVRPTIEIARAEEKIDLAVVSNEVLEISSAFSFRGLPSKALRDKILAWTYSMDKVRRFGGNLETQKKKRVLIPQRVPVLALVEPPSTTSQIALFNEATTDWGSLGIEMIRPDSVVQHAAILDHKLAAA
ncbi:hypothetical protein [uncultured Rothia sp.]|uniref:hypothetical protein n=1 Tax=uncultured Rothia sp. TaxID=316088 RepID=UPI003217BA6A